MPERRSKASQRMQSAGVRAMDAHIRVARAAKRLTEEMEEVTANHGIPVTNLDDGDSLVVAVVETRQAVKAVK